MTAGGPTGGAPTGGSPGPAGSGDWLVSGISSATFLNGANYASGVLFSAAGSGASFAGSGHATNVYQDGFIEWLLASDQVTPPAGRMIYSWGAGDNPFMDGFSAAVATTVQQKLSLTQGMQFTGQGTYIWTPGASIIEGVKLHGDAGGKVYMTVGMTQGLQVVHKQVLGLLAAITENIALTPVLEAYVGSVILNRLLMTDTAHATLKYAVTQIEALRIATAFARFAGAFVTESFVAQGSGSVAYAALAAITEQLTLALNQTYIMAFRINMRDGLDVDDDTALQMIYRQSVIEEIDIEILLQAPNGAMTTWAINTRTGATTEYKDWQFNSFARMGNKYIGANIDGLYELNGPTDDGISVVADIVGAFLQPAGQHLAGLKGVYLGQTGQGYWLLKIDTGDGREYVYQRLSNPGLMTTKFTIGKGINARYIGWELINVEGQDFDLDTIEFVPMLRTRRI